MRIKVHLAPNEKVIFARQSHANGVGDALDVANNGDHYPKYVIDPTKTFLRVRYKKSQNYKKEEEAFFQKRNIKLECIQDWFEGTGLTFEQRRRATPLKENKFPGLENRFAEKGIMGYLEAGEVENGNFRLENACFRPFNVTSWNLKINRHYIFDKPQNWQNSEAVRRFLWESQLDAIAHPEDIEARRFGALVDSDVDFLRGRCFYYGNLSTNSKISERMRTRK